MVAEGKNLKIVSESGVQSVMILSDMEFPCNQNLVVHGICDFDVHHKQLFATLLVLHLFLLFLLRKFIFYDEGYEKPHANACSDNNPEEDVVLGRQTEEDVAKSTDTQTYEDTAPSEATVFVLWFTKFPHTQ